MRLIPIISLLVIAVSLVVLGGGQALAAGCDATVTASNSIQAAVDANPGGKVCLDDSFGVFSQAVTFGPEDSGVTLTVKPGDSPVMDGTLFAGDAAIVLLGGVRDVSIDGLEIRNYAGNGIEAVDGTTSKITIRNNYLHNLGNGVNVRSDGSFTHDHWTVKNNFVSDNGARGITLQNTSHSKVEDNFVKGNGNDGILIEARNFLASGNLLVTNVKVKGNDVRDSGDDGIRLRARPNAGSTAHLTKIDIKNNYTQSSFDDGISVQARGIGATVDHVKIEGNTSQFNGEDGIQVQARDPGVVNKVTVKKNVVIGNVVVGIKIVANGSGTVMGMQVKENTVNSNGSGGVLLAASDGTTTVDGNKIERNSGTGNLGHGFFANTGSGINTFKKNESNLNLGNGYFEAAGPLTNVYQQNQCDFNGSGGSVPAGLCSP